MDSNKIWQLEDDMLPPLMDHMDFRPLMDQTWYSLSYDEHFGSSFSSSAISYDECYTPSRSNSFEVVDIDKFSSTNSLSSNGSTSPIDNPNLYGIKSMNYAVKNESDAKSNECVTPCENSIKGYEMINYDYSQVNDIYGSLDLQDDFSNLPGMMVNNLSDVFEATSSPLLSSPLEPYSQPDEEIKYFMSPREPQLRTRSPSFSSASWGSASERASERKLFQSSAALHRAQSSGSARIKKSVKGALSANSKIDRVAAGTFRCDYPGCPSKHGFKRHEHLKRHQRTHNKQIFTHCEFCPKKFPISRRDNFKSHVKLHTMNSKGSRTKYFPEAIHLLGEWEKRLNVDKKLNVPGEMYPYRSSSRKVKAGLYKSES